MKAENHLIVSVPTSISIWVLTDYSLWYFAMAFFLGFLVDVDHVFDYIREEHGFDFKNMFIKSYKGDFEKLYVWFHCMEYVPIAWIYGLISGNLEFAAVFSIAYLSHMIPDQLSNNVRPWGYFFIFRAMNGFKMSKIFYPPRKEERLY
ncbi:MAG: hypothetical protein LLG37_06305 [Spirochaetia bacterium]|nr:hypothetical protein [Spirochaetia bacterium]